MIKGKCNTISKLRKAYRTALKQLVKSDEQEIKISVADENHAIIAHRIGLDSHFINITIWSIDGSYVWHCSGYGKIHTTDPLLIDKIWHHLCDAIHHLKKDDENFIRGPRRFFNNDFFYQSIYYKIDCKDTPKLELKNAFDNRHHEAFDYNSFKVLDNIRLEGDQKLLYEGYWQGGRIL